MEALVSRTQYHRLLRWRAPSMRTAAGDLSARARRIDGARRFAADQDKQLHACVDRRPSSAALTLLPVGGWPAQRTPGRRRRGPADWPAYVRVRPPGNRTLRQDRLIRAGGSSVGTMPYGRATMQRWSPILCCQSTVHLIQSALRCTP